MRDLMGEGKTIDSMRLLDVTGAWVLASLPGGAVVSWSEEWLTVTGQPKQALSAGRTLGELFQDAPNGLSCEGLLKQASEGRPIPPHDVLIETGGGARRFTCCCLVVAGRGKRPAVVLCQVFPPPDAPGSGRARRLRLTGRQREILNLIVEGWSTDDIALELGLRPHTVRNHVRGLLRRLGVGTRLEAAVLAVRRGLV